MAESNSWLSGERAKPEQDPVPNRMLVIVAALILAAAVVLRIIFFSGYQGRDDAHYIAYAYMLGVEGHVASEHHTQWIGRIGMWTPMAATIAVFGFNAFGIFAYPFACGLAGFWLIYRTAALIFSRLAAVIACFLLALAPQDVIWSSHAYPDLPLGYFMVFCYYLFLRGENNRIQGRSSWIQYLGAGIAAGVAFLIRETAVVLVVPFALYICFHRRIRPQYSLLIAGGVCVLVLEAVFWWASAGDPFFRYNALLDKRSEVTHFNSGDSSRALPSPGVARRGGGYLLEPIVMFLTNQEFGLIYIFVWPIVAITLVQRRQGVWLAVWVAAIAFSISYLPITWPIVLNRNPRYYDCILIPSLALLAGWLSVQRSSVKWGTIGVLGFSSLICIYLDASRFSAQPLKAIANEIQRRPQATFWMPPRERFGLFVATDPECLGRVGVHMFQTAQTADALHNIKMVCPETKTVMLPSDVQDGFVILRSGELDEIDIPESWRVVSEVRPRRNRVVHQASNVLNQLGVPDRYTRMLYPDRGTSWLVWQVGEKGK